MAANIITFDSDYMRERAKTVTDAKKLVDDARACLKRANRHDGWSCSERVQINDSLRDVSSRLDRLSTGLGTFSTTLDKGAGQFADLESRALSEENAMSGQLKKNTGFEAIKWIIGVIGGIGQKIGDALKSLLPVTPVPSLPNTSPPVTVAPPSEGTTAIMPETTPSTSEMRVTGVELLNAGQYLGKANPWPNEQCKGFVKNIFLKELGIRDVVPESASNGKEWARDGGEYFDRVGQEIGTPVTSDIVRNFWKELREGDAMQVNWQTNTEHTMIVDSIEKDEYGNITAIKVLHANYPSGNRVSVDRFSVEEFASQFKGTDMGMTAYRYNGKTPETQN
jgi:hypothetical protein